MIMNTKKSKIRPYKGCIAEGIISNDEPLDEYQIVNIKDSITIYDTVFGGSIKEADLKIGKHNSKDTWVHLVDFNVLDNAVDEKEFRPQVRCSDYNIFIRKCVLSDDKYHIYNYKCYIVKNC